MRGLDSEWIAPSLWVSEFRNVLRNYIAGGHLTLAKALGYMSAAEALMRGRDYAVSSVTVLALVAASGCTAYDCEYVALAKAVGVPLVTTDKAVLRAFPETAIRPEDFGS